MCRPSSSIFPRILQTASMCVAVQKPRKAPHYSCAFILVVGVGAHGTAHGATHAGRGVVLGASHAAAAVAKVLLAEGGEALLLGGGVDVRADDEADDVEEGDPEVVGQELLGKGEGEGRDDPRDLHDLPEADLDGGADLVEGAGAGDESHGDEVDAVLDGSDLGKRKLAGVARR